MGMSGERNISRAREALSQAEAAFRQGRLPETIAHCERALAVEATLVPALTLLAAAAQKQGNLARARDALERVATLAPRSADAHFNLGAVRCQAGDLDGGVAALAVAFGLDAAPATAALLAQAHNARGNALMTTSPAKARDDFARAGDLQPQEPGYAVNLGNAEVSLGRFAEAAIVLRRALARAPGNIEARLSLSRALIGVERFGEAVQEAERAVRDSGGDVRARLNLGSALGRAGDSERAVEVYRALLAVAPNHAAAWTNLGNVLQDLARGGEAINAYDRALGLEPGLQTAIDQRALTLLLTGRLAEGWQAYRHRAAMRGRERDFHRQVLAADLGGTNVLVRRDQGLGDEVFFLRFVAPLRARGARVVYEPAAKLAPVLAGWRGVDGLHGSDHPAPDMVLAVSDLPTLLGCGDRDYLTSITLEPDAAALGRARDILTAAGKPPYVGLTWRAGTPNDPASLYKEAPLDELIELLRRLPVSVVSLQRGVRRGELEGAAKGLGRPIADLSVLNDDLVTMLALLALLDDYVCVSNTNVHLRVAAGRPCRVLIPNPEFRWMEQGDESPWFPGTRLYRRGTKHDWSNALARLADELAKDIGK
jgi:tetratricopeptide (TPR) repeat protein